MRRAVLLATALLAAAGCGSTGNDRPGVEASLLLDFTPNAVHSGIYLAHERGYDAAEGVTLKVRAPTESTDAPKLLEAGKADFAILDIHDLGLARERGADLVGVMALVQRPLAAVLAQPRIETPRELEHERVGVTGLPSDVAVLHSVVKSAGGDPSKVRETTIGFDAVKAMLANRVAGATAFWNVEGVALKERRPRTREFRVDEYGAPPYPELVLCVTRRTLDERRAVVQAAIRGLQRGYLAAQDDPESALSAMTAAVPELDRDALAPQLDAVAPAFTAGASTYGELRPDVLHQWAEWDVEFGILSSPPDIAKAFDTTLVGTSPQR